MPGAGCQEGQIHSYHKAGMKALFRIAYISPPALLVRVCPSQCHPMSYGMYDYTKDKLPAQPVRQIRLSPALMLYIVLKSVTQGGHEWLT